MNTNIKSVTLMELMVSIIIISFIILSFYSISTFSHNQVINSERRSSVQNELSYALAHMSKYVQQANGSISNPAISLTGAGFQVRIDFIQTPSDATDDALISYSLSGNTLSAKCAGAGCPFVSETVSTKIISNFSNSIMPVNPVNGFYVWITAGSVVDIGLTGRFNVASGASIRNPQVSMKTKIICHNCSAN